LKLMRKTSASRRAQVVARPLVASPDQLGLRGLIRPLAAALITASERIVALSLVRAESIWKSIVRLESCSSSAISDDVRPLATRERISI